MRAETERRGYIGDASAHECMGGESMTTTIIYLRSNDEEVAAAVHKLATIK